MKKSLFFAAVVCLFLLASCGHNVSHLGMGSAFRLGSGEFSLSYYDGLFLSSVNRENMRFCAEIDSTVGASYDPVTGSFKGIKSVEVETGPQITGYTADLAEKSPEAVAAYYDALKAYYQANNKAPASPLISDAKSQVATSSVADIVKNAIAAAKGIVQDKEAANGEEAVFQCNGDCDYADLTQNPEISYQLSIALKLLTYDGYQKRMPSTDEYYTTTLEHFVTQLVTYRASGHKNTPLRVKYVTVEKGVVTKLMYVYTKRDGTSHDVECPSCVFMDPQDAD